MPRGRNSPAAAVSLRHFPHTALPLPASGRGAAAIFRRNHGIYPLPVAISHPRCSQAKRRMTASCQAKSVTIQVSVQVKRFFIPASERKM